MHLESIDLEPNTDKTKILYQPAPNTNVPGPAITINEATLENIEYFSYLGSYLSVDANIDAEVQHRLKCASAAFGRLLRRLFDSHDLGTQTKVSVLQRHHHTNTFIWM